jgi:putative oxidoreductase
MLAIAELLLLSAFVLGMAPRITYGIVFLLQAISTFSFQAQYPRLCELAKIQFFAAWSMLAACFALNYLRDLDTLRYSVD